MAQNKDSIIGFKFFGTFAVIAIGCLLWAWISKEPTILTAAMYFGIGAGVSLLIAIIIAIWES